MTTPKATGHADPVSSVASDLAGVGARNVKAIAFMTISMALFAFDDMLIKIASAEVGVGQMMTIQCLLGVVYFGTICLRRNERVSRAALASAPILVRNISEIVGALCFVTALTLIPISNASAILQATPLALTLGAALVLREPVGWRRWSAIAVGFIGVLIVVRPGAEGFDHASLLAVLAVFAFAARDLATRVAPASVSTEMIALVASGSVAIAAIILETYSGGWTLMRPGILLMLLAASALGIVGFHFMLIAIRTGEVSVVAPFRYVRIVCAIAIGYVVFNEQPSVFTYLGSVLIAASGLYTLYREQVVRNRG